MFTKKKIIFTILGALLISFVLYFGLGIFDYFKYQNYVEASLGKLQDGGKITDYRSTCLLDSCTPVDPASCSVGVPAAQPCGTSPSCPCVTCALSCPCASAMWGSGCAGRTELHVISQYQTTFLTPRTGFVYKGGGTLPSPGMQYIYIGTPADPWAVGIPGAGFGRIDKIINWFDKYVIAAFKE